MMFKTHLTEVQYLLKRGGFTFTKLHRSTSLAEDLKFHHIDYYFLKLDIEELTKKEIDIDRIFSCTIINDVIELIRQ
jgi:hypothetical protein